MRLFRFLWLSLALCLLVVESHASIQKKSSRDVYKQDVAFALDALEKECGRFFKLKGIKWKPVRSEFTKSSNKVTTDETLLGIEGIGIEPHGNVPLDLDDLRSGRDTHIQRAVDSLNDLSAKKVGYEPQNFGWSYKGK